MYMKELVIIYNQPLSSKQGINSVNNSFIEGQTYFNKRGINLSNIFGSDRVHKCENSAPLADNASPVSTKKNNRYLTLLKKIIPRNIALIDAVKIYNSCYATAKKSFKRFVESGCDPDYIIFQDPQTAELYYKNVSGKKAKTIMILHCSLSATEQAETMWTSFFENVSLSRKFYATYEYAMSHVDMVIYLSQRAVDHSPVAPDKKTYIFNGEEDLADHAFVESGDVINCVSVASMSWRKGHEFVLEAMTKLPKEVLNKIKYHMIGAGPQMQELKDYVAFHNLEDNVVFYGNRNDVPELLKGMDVFILPSKSEGLPMSIIEALRQGMYLVATDTGAIPEMIAPGCGELVERNADQIADCLTRFVKDGSVTMEVKKKAREHYLENFTLKNMIYKYCDVLNSL